MIIKDIYSNSLKITKTDVLNYVKYLNNYYIVKNIYNFTDKLYKKIKQCPFTLDYNLSFYTDIEENKKRFLESVFYDFNVGENDRLL